MKWSKNGVHVIAENKELRDKIRRERERFRLRLWRARPENKAKAAANFKRWAEANKEYEKARKQRWQRENKRAINAYRRRRYQMLRLSGLWKRTAPRPRTPRPP